MRVLITGGAGFIGSELSKIHRLRGDEICIIDNFLPQVHGDESLIENKKITLRKEYILHDISLVERESVLEIVEEFKPDICYHMAADTGTGQSQNEWERYVNTNIIGTCNLLAALNACSNFAKLILPSSRSIYGEGPYLSENGSLYNGTLNRKVEDMRIGKFDLYDEKNVALTPATTKESSKIDPISLYASTKLMQELLLKQFERGNWEFTILRFQNVYGAGQSLSNPYTGVLSIFSTQLLQGKDIEIYEDGNIYRDFVYVTDVANACVLAATSTSCNGMEINIGSGIASKMTYVADLLIKNLNPSSKFDISGKFRFGDIKYACANIDLAEELLGWKPTISLELGVEKLCKWVLKEND
ncbi:TPA: NAD-dependent epimerase/dehydratase family protein [Vibrio parahaemolyticus]|uniref:NAD-dependent epimerase/dehydratase family protein n=1 Tax=Vibrio parahaemolyticus TaxID=670 RepID=UPI00226AC3B0|nr:NAD-dependent epimerase/dehydratase family protein [Vibrio parahaemolyticus]MCX8925358.1 NAD-dependent epimerase/dehydratase family protein [Vibrio parahaemolyticus]HCG6131697.1 NAD-dependent epimerase/dehydratase family protein [Vibrio parahaemolyticus]HCG8183297.1 NAD-dependent epimerase/dehydratase family protein [Vibrio parahaemolyticus]HCG9431067.1 NAD-dependent epimerase/dehydratase family protein [Vibrio parahaemolyticus]HCG9628191.1 NAD-dependent epimerase/dehydratase family protein